MTGDFNNWNGRSQVVERRVVKPGGPVHLLEHVRISTCR